MVARLVFFLFAVGGPVRIGVSYWVSNDASERNVDSPALRGVVALFVGIFGPLIYVLVRE